MSGTSADGIDVAIVDIDAKQRQVVAYDMVRYPAAIRRALLGVYAIRRRQRSIAICHYNFLLGRLFATALIDICKKHTITLNSIDLIGSHGQTIYHIPSGRKFGTDSIRSTLQDRRAVCDCRDDRDHHRGGLRGRVTLPVAVRARPWCHLPTICCSAIPGIAGRFRILAELPI